MDDLGDLFLLRQGITFASIACFLSISGIKYVVSFILAYPIQSNRCPLDYTIHFQIEILKLNIQSV